MTRRAARRIGGGILPTAEEAVGPLVGSRRVPDYLLVDPALLGSRFMRSSRLRGSTGSHYNLSLLQHVGAHDAAAVLPGMPALSPPTVAAELVNAAAARPSGQSPPAQSSGAGAGAGAGASTAIVVASDKRLSITASNPAVRRQQRVRRPSQPGRVRRGSHNVRRYSIGSSGQPADAAQRRSSALGTMRSLATAVDATERLTAHYRRASHPSVAKGAAAQLAKRRRRSRRRSAIGRMTLGMQALPSSLSGLDMAAPGTATTPVAARAAAPPPSHEAYLADDTCTAATAAAAASTAEPTLERVEEEQQEEGQPPAAEDGGNAVAIDMEEADVPCDVMVDMASDGKQDDSASADGRVVFDTSNTMQQPRRLRTSSAFVVGRGPSGGVPAMGYMLPTRAPSHMMRLRKPAPAPVDEHLRSLRLRVLLAVVVLCLVQVGSFAIKLAFAVQSMNKLPEVDFAGL